MPIKFSCGKCNTVLQVKDELAGKKGLCPKCKNPIQVPMPSSLPSSADELSLAPSPSPASAPAASPAPAPKPAPAPGQAPVAAAAHAPSPLKAPPAPAAEPKHSLLMIQKVGPVMVITIMKDRITEMSDIRDMGDELMSKLELQEKPSILLDFSKVTYLPSAMIGKLTAMHKKATTYKGKVKLCAISSGVMQIFKITRLDKVFEIFPDQNAALNSFERGLTKNL